MARLNLFEKLSDLDKKRIENYLHFWGTGAKTEDNIEICDFEEYFASWNKNKSRLCRILGGELIKKIPISYERDEKDMKNEMHMLISGTYLLSKLNHNFDDLKYELFNLGEKDDVEAIKLATDYYHNISHDLRESRDKTITSLKIRMKDSPKMLQLQAGTTPMKALGKIVRFFAPLFEMYLPDEKAEKLIAEYDNFRVKQSIILNDRKITGNLCFSIHPMDFMTMSDNNSNWTSCMNWIDCGCYHLGTVEMMNSNNVVCCYLENTREEFNFYPKNSQGKKKDAEEYKWNNKRWRILLYVTPEIIVSGKSYPYSCDGIAQIAVKEMQNLAKKNLGWTYQYGIEQYRDMDRIDSARKIDKNGAWIMNHVNGKNFDKRRKYIGKMNYGFNQKIIFDTRLMYNDMFNDKYTYYWCVRNRVKKTTIISYSGPCNCLICNTSLNNKDDIQGNYYNERWDNTSRLLCYDCRAEGECEYCWDFKGKNNLMDIEFADGCHRHMCKDCVKKYVYICPFCKKPFNIDSLTSEKSIFYKKDSSAHISIEDLMALRKIKLSLQNGEDKWLKEAQDHFKNNIPMYEICICEDCRKEMVSVNRLEKIEVDTGKPWWTEGYYCFNGDTSPIEEFEPYFYQNLVKYIDFK